MLESDLFEESVGTVLSTALEHTTDETFVINPSQYAIERFVETLDSMDDPPSIRLFVDEEPMKALTDDFLVASVVADLVVNDTLSIRTLDTVPRHALVLTESGLVSVIEGTDEAAGLTTGAEDFVANLYARYEDEWADAEQFSLRTPALSHVRETLESDISPEAVADFDEILETLDTARGDGDGLDEVEISLLVAAKNNVLLYDISRWGEDIRLASKATFSRSKNQLEDAGIIETEKVPIEVGRPRLRLKLGSSELEAASPSELVERTQSALA
jgi:hypothetical protein